LSPLPPINTTPATDLHLSFSFTAAVPPAPPPPPRQVNFPPPSYYFRDLRFLLHAEHSFCMQEDGGKIIPPVGFLCWARTVLAQLVLFDGPGWSWPSPAFWAGSGPEENISFWAEIGPIHFGPKSALHFWAESGPVGWAGPAQPI
jgi:hypothetical protein